MGSRMAMNIIKAGDQVRVWNWSAKAAEPLVGAGATHAAPPIEAAAGRDFVIAMLATTTLQTRSGLTLIPVCWLA